MLLGWFGYKGRLGPMNTVISSNVVRRSRQAAIQYRGDGVDGAIIISANQIVHSGYPNSVPPGPESRRPIDPHKLGYGRGIYCWSLQDVQIVSNSVSHSLGPAISSVGATHVVIASNIVSAEGAQLNSTGIMLDSSTDVLVSGNNVRGFAVGISMLPPPFGKSDRVQIRGNNIDVSAIHGGGAGEPVAVSVAANVAHAVVADNVVTGTAAGGAATCVIFEGTNSSTRVQRNNECW